VTVEGLTAVGSVAVLTPPAGVVVVGPDAVAVVGGVAGPPALAELGTRRPVPAPETCESPITPTKAKSPRRPDRPAPAKLARLASAAADRVAAVAGVFAAAWSRRPAVPAASAAVA